MKFEKLDKKQIPQVLILSVLALGVIGYAGFTYLSQAPVATASGTAGPGGGAAGPAVQPVLPITVLPAGAVGGQYNADPFKPAFRPGEDGLKPMVRVSRNPGFGEMALPFPGLPPAPSGVAGPARQPGTGQGTAEAAPPVPGPERPTCLVTGVIDAEDGASMAIVKFGERRQIVSLGDAVSNDYWVKEIKLTGITLVNGKDRFFVPVSKPEATAPTTELGPLVGPR